MPDKEAREPRDRPDLKRVDGVDKNVTTVEKTARRRCKVLQKAWPKKGCSASDGIGGENSKHKMLIFLSETFVTMIKHVNIYSLLVT
jgi:hypothetical protein